MVQVRGDFDLLQKAIWPKRDREFGAQHLDRHQTFVLQILGEVDRRHPAAADLPLDGVAVGESGFQAVEHLRHGRFPLPCVVRALKRALGACGAAS